MQENDSCLSLNDRKGAYDLFVLQDLRAQKCPCENGEKLSAELKEEVREEKMKDVKNILNFENSNMAELKYWFANPMRSGSLIFISSKDYQVLMKGHSS